MYNNYCKLRDSRHVKDSDVAKQTGITKSTFSDWKTGRSIPKQEKLQKIADYFDVSLDYLVNGTKAENYYINEETAKIAQEVFENPELRSLFDVARDISPERLQAHIDFIKKMKDKEQGE